MIRRTRSATASPIAGRLAAGSRERPSNAPSINHGTMPPLRTSFAMLQLLAANLAKDAMQPQRKFRFTREWLGVNYRWVAGWNGVTNVDFFELFPGARDLTIDMEIHTGPENLLAHEVYYLCAIAKLIDARRIFEFGTFDGQTTLHLAMNLPEAEITTVALPPGQTIVPGERDVVAGGRFAGRPEAARVTQLLGDSTEMHFGHLYGQFDFVFIDGGHDYAAVRSDTRNALRLVRPGGVIAWDDYPPWEGVKRVVERVAHNHPVFRLDRTKLAVLVTEDSKG